ncbi:lipoprotein-releasing system ATP-binding protein LolD [Candidatus Dependentiae bacterium HGW-Dependentiae-1]|nr:MAG: lipoprotein-releasing system ATP-binding protein LolD [Candidatus Dependentiae bacterium HGW-Dependentiae-1]
MNNPAVLATHDLKKTFIQGDVQLEVLKGVSVSFIQGKSYALTGASGTGKSTFMHLLCGLDTPDSGSVSFAGNAIVGFTAAERQAFLNKSVGLVFQLPYLIQELSVLENVQFKGLLAGKSPAECTEKAHLLLKQVGLEQKAQSKPGALSGGQQQRVAIARAIFNEPAFLLADEPTGSVDVDTGMLIVDLLLACKKQWGMGIIVSSHDAYVAETMGTVYRLEHGLLKIV